MNSILKKLADEAANTADLASSIAESGLKSVSDVFEGTQIFGSLMASSTEDTIYDETHYLLVPLLGKDAEHAIYTKRILPPDTGSVNSLPKARIFHVSDESGRDLLEQELVAKLVRDRNGDAVGPSEFADTLDHLADQIDNETSKLSGGLLLIGTAVAIVNPVVGIGIAAKGLLPSISAKASKAGADYVGNRLRVWNKSSMLSNLKKKASKKVRKLKPQIYSNPIIRSLDAITSNPETDFDPSFDHRNWVDQFESTRHYAVTLEALREIYRPVWEPKDLHRYQSKHLTWIETLMNPESQGGV